MIGARRLRYERSGAATVEFGLIAGIFLPLCLAILDGGLLLWTAGTLQSSASLTARCAALASPDCSDVQQFAVDRAANWAFSGVIARTDVSSAVVCISHTSYQMVTITCQFWAGSLLPPPLNGKALTSVAYHPNSSMAC